MRANQMFSMKRFYLPLSWHQKEHGTYVVTGRNIHDAIRRAKKLIGLNAKGRIRRAVFGTVKVERYSINDKGESVLLNEKEIISRNFEWTGPIKDDEMFWSWTSDSQGCYRISEIFAEKEVQQMWRMANKRRAR